MLKYGAGSSYYNVFFFEELYSFLNRYNVYLYVYIKKKQKKKTKNIWNYKKKYNIPEFGIKN